jgi:alpha-D-ribose 1-methylphosphonate 5-triphosphate synthase subunit PhnG
MDTSDRASGQDMAAAMGKPTTIAQCHAVIDLLIQRVALQEERLAALQEQLKLNSKNRTHRSARIR